MSEHKYFIPYIDLGKQWSDIRSIALTEIDKVLSSGKYLEHEVIERLEHRLQNYLQVEHVVTVNSGTDALLMSLKAMGIEPKDEVITVPNSFIASVAAIEHVGARTVFVDVGDDHLLNVEKVRELISPKTRAIMPVHLEGKMCDMLSLKKIADEYGLKIIEDAAQAFGSKYGGISPGQLSDVACFSLHPLKNLNGIGDGGFIATNDPEIASSVRLLRNHGQESRNKSSAFGFVSRLDSVQAAVLNIRLDRLDEVISKRRKLACHYDKLLKSSSVNLPLVGDGVFHTYHLYVIEVENRDEIQQGLSDVGIETKVHYPTLISNQPAFQSRTGEVEWNIPKAEYQSRRILSLPIHQYLTLDDVTIVSECLKDLL